MENSVATSSKKRNGFVTFWLWLEIIANVIFPIYTTITYMGIVRYVDEYYVYGLIAVAIISAVLLVSGYALLLRWRRKGFLVDNMDCNNNGRHKYHIYVWNFRTCDKFNHNRTFGGICSNNTEAYTDVEKRRNQLLEFAVIV